MPQETDDGRYRLSLKLPQELLDRVESLGDERRWSRSQTVRVLLSEGISGPDHGTEIPDEPGLLDSPISLVTDDGDMVRNVEGLADEEYGNSFNAAARWALRNGLAEMNDN